MNAAELFDALNACSTQDLHVSAKIGESSLPIFFVDPHEGFFSLTALYKDPWSGARKNGRELRKHLTALMGDGEGELNGNSPIRIYLEINTADYGSKGSFFEINSAKCSSDGLVLAAGVELANLEKRYPPSPHLLKMQKKEPFNKIYFPFRPGVDKE